MQRSRIQYLSLKPIIGWNDLNMLSSDRIRSENYMNTVVQIESARESLIQKYIREYSEVGQNGTKTQVKQGRGSENKVKHPKGRTSLSEATVNKTPERPQKLLSMPSLIFSDGRTNQDLALDCLEDRRSEDFVADAASPQGDNADLEEQADQEFHEFIKSLNLLTRRKSQRIEEKHQKKMGEKENAPVFMTTGNRFQRQKRRRINGSSDSMAHSNRGRQRKSVPPAAMQQTNGERRRVIENVCKMCQDCRLQALVPKKRGRGRPRKTAKPQNTAVGKCSTRSICSHVSSAQSMEPCSQVANMDPNVEFNIKRVPFVKLRRIRVEDIESTVNRGADMKASQKRAPVIDPACIRVADMLPPSRQVANCTPSSEHVPSVESSIYHDKNLEPSNKHNPVKETFCNNAIRIEATKKRVANADLSTCEVVASVESSKEHFENEDPLKKHDTSLEPSKKPSLFVKRTVKLVKNVKLPRKRYMNVKRPKKQVLTVEPSRKPDATFEPPKNQGSTLETPMKLVGTLEPSNKPVIIVEPPRNHDSSVEFLENQRKNMSSSKNNDSIRKPFSKHLASMKPQNNLVATVRPSKKNIKSGELSRINAIMVEPSRKCVANVELAKKHAVGSEPSKKPVAGMQPTRKHIKFVEPSKIKVVTKELSRKQDKVIKPLSKHFKVVESSIKDAVSVETSRKPSLSSKPSRGHLSIAEDSRKKVVKRNKESNAKSENWKDSFAIEPGYDSSDSLDGGGYSQYQSDKRTRWMEKEPFDDFDFLFAETPQSPTDCTVSWEPKRVISKDREAARQDQMNKRRQQAQRAAPYFELANAADSFLEKINSVRGNTVDYSSLFPELEMLPDMDMAAPDVENQAEDRGNTSEENFSEFFLSLPEDELGGPDACHQIIFSDDELDED